MTPAERGAGRSRLQCCPVAGCVRDSWAVFSGSHDGHLRGFSTTDGRMLWDIDTGIAFQTVNGVAAGGGPLDHGGATVAGGRVFVNSGYGRINGQPGNVLPVYGLP